jgi:hypothetical protein
LGDFRTAIAAADAAGRSAVLLRVQSGNAADYVGLTLTAHS